MKPSDDLKAQFTYYTGPDAQTAVEMGNELGVSYMTIRRMIPRFLASGKWKEVMVKRGGHISKAYISTSGSKRK